MKKFVRAGLTATAIVAALTLPASAAQADDLCNVNVNTWVTAAPGGDYKYTIPAGGGFRLQGYTAGYWYGHGNGQSSGWIKDDGRLYNC